MDCKLTPVEIAASVYQREECARPFQVDLELHLLHGWVLSTPAYFLMGRAVWSGADAKDILDPMFTDFPLLDCWHCYLCAGDWREAARDGIALAGERPYVSFERRNVLRVLRWGDFLEKKVLHTPYGVSIHPPNVIPR